MSGIDDALLPQLGQLRTRIFRDIDAERLRQLDKWGDQRHPDGTTSNWLTEESREVIREKVQRAARAGTTNWFDILREEVYEAGAENPGPMLRAELVQAGAVIVAWLEDLDRRDGVIPPDWSASASELGIEACRVCGCTENAPCPGGCSWAPDPQMEDLCSRCVDAALRVTVTDLENGESATRGVPTGDYLMLAVEPCHYTVAPLPDGTHIITVRGRTEGEQ